jgi:hypothetical protein
VFKYGNFSHDSGSLELVNNFCLGIRQLLSPFLQVLRCLSHPLHTLDTEFYNIVTWVEFHFLSPGSARRLWVPSFPPKLRSPWIFYCFETFASRKSLIIGTIVVMRFISVTCVVSGKIANLDAGRGCMSPWISPPPFSRNISAM